MDNEQDTALDAIRSCADHMKNRVNFLSRDRLLHEQRQEPFATALRRIHALYVTVGVLIKRLPPDTDDSAPIEMSERRRLTRQNKDRAKDVRYAGEDAADIRAMIKRALADGYMSIPSRYYSGHAFALKSLYEALERFFAGPPPRERKQKPKAKTLITAETDAGPLNLSELVSEPTVSLDNFCQEKQDPPPRTHPAPRALLSLDTAPQRKKTGRPPRSEPPAQCKQRGCTALVDTHRGGARGLCATHYQQRRRAASLCEDAFPMSDKP